MELVSQMEEICQKLTNSSPLDDYEYLELMQEAAQILEMKQDINQDSHSTESVYIEFMNALAIGMRVQDKMHLKHPVILKHLTSVTQTLNRQNRYFSLNRK